MQSPLHFDAWARTKNSTVVVASNTKEVPDLPHWNSEIVWPTKPCIDGRWGMAEYSLIPQYYDVKFPYLAWLPTQKFHRLGLPTQINSFRIEEDPSEPNSVFVRHSGWTHRGHLNTDIREELQRDVVHYIEAVNGIILEGNSTAPPEVQPPVISLVRAHNSAFSMRFPHLTYRDLLEYLAGLQRSVAELQAYSLWYDRIQYGDIPASHRSFELGLRGSVARTHAEYISLRRLGVPVWLELVSTEGMTLDTVKQVQLTTLRIETRTWDEMPVSRFLSDTTRKGKLVHNKPLEYYPPVVDDISTYESAARGYSARKDIFCRDMRAAHDVLSMMKTCSLISLFCAPSRFSYLTRQHFPVPITTSLWIWQGRFVKQAAPLQS